MKQQQLIIPAAEQPQSRSRSWQVNVLWSTSWLLAFLPWVIWKWWYLVLPILFLLTVILVIAALIDKRKPVVLQEAFAPFEESYKQGYQEQVNQGSAPDVSGGMAAYSYEQPQLEYPEQEPPQQG